MDLREDLLWEDRMDRENLLRMDLWEDLLRMDLREHLLRMDLWEHLLRMDLRKLRELLEDLRDLNWEVRKHC